MACGAQDPVKVEQAPPALPCRETTGHQNESASIWQTMEALFAAGEACLPVLLPDEDPRLDEPWGMPLRSLAVFSAQAGRHHVATRPAFRFRL